MILERARRRMHVAVAIGDDRRAVEHHRVLPADDVEVRQRAPGFAHAIGDQRVALRMLVAFERRGVGHQHQLRARFHRARQRLGEPQVFADHHADARAVDFEHARLAIGIDVEVAALVEHRVVRQFALAIGLFDHAVAQHARGVVDDRAGGLRPTDDGDDARRGLRDARDRRFAIGEEARPQQQVFRRIAAERELGEQHDVGAVEVAGLRDQGGDAVGVGRDRAHREVELRERDAERHARSLTNRRYAANRACSASVATGFTRCWSNPADSARWRSAPCPYPVTATTLASRVRGSSRKRRTTS